MASRVTGFLLTRHDTANQDMIKELSCVSFSCPVEDVVLHDDPWPDKDFQALICTSMNGIRWIHEKGHFPLAKNIPLWTVGEASAHFARHMGFQQVYAGPGYAKGLLPLMLPFLNKDRVIGHLGGKDIRYNIVNDLVLMGFKAKKYTVYHREIRSKLPDDVQKNLMSGHISHVVFFSIHTAKNFSKFLHELPLLKLSAVCLSYEIASFVKDLYPWQELIFPPHPSKKKYDGSDA